MLAIGDLNLDDIQSGAFNGAFRYNTVGEIIGGAIPIILLAAGVMLLIYLIVGGFNYMTTKGDPRALQTARGHITSALIGFIIVFTAFWIVQAIGVIFKINAITDIFG